MYIYIYKYIYKYLGYAPGVVPEIGTDFKISMLRHFTVAY